MFMADVSGRGCFTASPFVRGVVIIRFCNIKSLLERILPPVLLIAPVLSHDPKDSGEMFRTCEDPVWKVLGFSAI
jgi:hypothetical protein